MRRLAFLAFWLGLTFLLAWYPPVNTAVKGDVPSRWTPTETMYPFPARPPEPSPTAALDQPTATVVPSVLRPAASLSGPPTWYCLAGISRCTRGHPDGPGLDLFAAAGPSIRRAFPDWRGRTVTVCADRCLDLVLIDFCACGGDHFLDLYHDAWVALGRPARVTVTP